MESWILIRHGRRCGEAGRYQRWKGSVAFRFTRHVLRKTGGLAAWIWTAVIILHGDFNGCDRARGPL